MASHDQELESEGSGPLVWCAILGITCLLLVFLQKLLWLVVPALLAHARKIAARPDWRFQRIDHIGIPEQDSQADMVCFFSVFTHLTHEQSYWYLEEAKRVLKPGGRVVFSFLELREPAHLNIFLDTVAAMKRKVAMPMNTCIDRETIAHWAAALGLEVMDIRDGAEPIVPEGSLGQSTCVLAKPD